ncbi:transposase [Paraburkholderia sp. RCC_158]|uniref:transposase n=1 Tax=Paraburkholderia sp. RCC_158 TaxID=3239220 RepID=UPI003524F043
MRRPGSLGLGDQPIEAVDQVPGPYCAVSTAASLGRPAAVEADELKCVGFIQLPLRPSSLPSPTIQIRGHALPRQARESSSERWSASLGLTPKQNSSGGKERLLGISKRGDAYVRCLLIHGARAMIQMARRRTDALSLWVMSIAAKRHPNVAAVALANKTARIAWAMITRGTDYQPEPSAY